jgi:hypothetical protein
LVNPIVTVKDPRSRSNNNSRHLDKLARMAW